MRIFSTLALAAACASAPVAVHATDGVEHDVIRFAQIAPLAGPAAATGLGLRAGRLAAFDEANRAGGIHGRTVALETLCDGGNPAAAVARMRTVLASRAHVAVIATSGAAQARAIQPMANAETLPLIGAATGEEALRAPWATNAFNIRPTKTAEIRALATHLVETALDAHDIAPVAHGRFQRGTTAIKVALLPIRRSGPDAVLLLGGHDAAAAFIRVAETLDFAPVFAGLSDTDGMALAAALGKAAEGVVLAAAVPWLAGDTPPIVTRYRAALAAIDPAAGSGFASLEGYLAGRFALTALEDAGPRLDRSRLMAAFGRMGEIDLGGLTLHFAPGDNQGLDDAFLFRIAPEGRLAPIETPPPEGTS